jgi:hypothetical protein
LGIVDRIVVCREDNATRIPNRGMGGLETGADVGLMTSMG